MLELKEYQKATLAVLEEYLERSSVLQDPAKAFARVTAAHPSDVRQTPYRSRWNMDGVPYVCLRLPTGGGKTLLAAHSVGIAARTFLHTEHPFALWLVPTNTIRQQTAHALRKPDHPYREALNTVFGMQGVAVFDIEDLNSIRPEDIFGKTCIVVATMQTFRVADSNKDFRKIYGHNENLEQHFLHLPNRDEALDRGDDGKVLYSFVNLVHQLRPLVIVDEAHKMVSQLSGEVMQRINPACVVEFTATPVESNVLYRVFPSALKAEEMVKLPFNLSEHATWEDAVLRAVETRNVLAALAAKDEAYIRPIVLFQAEKKNQNCTVETLKAFLIEHDVPAAEIAIATGEQRELDSIDVFSRDCPIKYVITVEALKEGWDCSFAYVFCSVANIRSAIDVEQLLGRVMRMPYARARKERRLNMAYAHVTARSFSEAAEEMYGRMLNMGFGEAEAANQIQQSSLIPSQEKGFENTPLGRIASEPKPLIITLKKAPDLSGLGEAAEGIEVRRTDIGFEVTSKGMMSPEVEDAILKVAPQKDHTAIRSSVALHRQAVAAHMPKSPAAKGEPFAVPLLLIDMDGEWEEADPELLVSTWTPLQFLRPGEAPLTREEFTYDGQEQVFQFDLDGEKLIYKYLEVQEQLTLYAPQEDMSIRSLSRKLDRLCQADDVNQPDMLEFCRRCLESLIARDGADIALLYRGRDILAQCIRRKINNLRERARKESFRQLLLTPTPRVKVSFDYAPAFPLDGYAEGVPAYSGNYQFRKHYYDRPRDLKSSGEEFRCARDIDRHPTVRTWVRNVDRQEGSFWLPTSHYKFYPDFVAMLHDGRILVIEYKGKNLLTNADTEEKRNIGELWEASSHGKGVFMLVCEADAEHCFEKQMERLLSKAGN